MENTIIGISLSICLLLFISICIIFNNKNSIRKVKTKNIAPFGFNLFYTDETTKTRRNNVIYKKILHSSKYNIQGKPDYIYKRFNSYYPVELKSGIIGDRDNPYIGDLFQLIAYFLIIEDLYGARPKEGRLIYSDCTFIVKNRFIFRRRLLSTLKSMRHMLHTGVGKANYSYVHCRYCVCKNTVCSFCENMKK